jgi:hypothetical protein
VSTNASGEIDTWVLQAFQTRAISSFEERRIVMLTYDGSMVFPPQLPLDNVGNTRLLTIDDRFIADSNGASVTNAPGTWSIRQIPEPSILTLLGIAVLGLIGYRRST